MPKQNNHAKSVGPQILTEASNTEINGGTIQVADTINNSTIPEQNGLELLKRHIALGAFHDSGLRSNPPRCHPKTRKAIQEKIEAWVKKRPGNGKRLILWMYGPAGAGKSAIAQSIAELCEQIKLLAASFFFSHTTSGCSDNTHLVATLAWQLTLSIPEISETVRATLERDPTILSRTPAAQMKVLITDPLNTVTKEILLKRPRLILIDGLDECLPNESQINGRVHTKIQANDPLHTKSQIDILNFVSNSLRDLHTPLYFLISSRPNREIREAFNSDHLKSLTDPLSLEDDPESTKDIHHFLTSSFAEMRRKNPHLPQFWPAVREIDSLVKKASRQFIYPETVIRYVRGHGSHGHEDRLKTVLNLRPPGRDSPFTMLDALLHQIFQSVREDGREKVMEVLGALIYIRKFKFQKLSNLEPFFGFRPGELESVMGDLLSLVYIPDRDDPNGIIKIYHASLPDFLRNRSRSEPFYLDPSATYVKLAHRCIERDRLRRFDPPDPNISPYAYLTIYLECIERAIFTEQLCDLLLSFSIWTAPGEFQMIFDPVFGEQSTCLMRIFRQEQAVNSTWARIYRKESKQRNAWINQLFTSVPPAVRSVMPVALSLGANEIHSDGSLILIYLYFLSTLSVEHRRNFQALPDYYFTKPRYCKGFVRYIAAKIGRRSGAKFRMTDSLYADFSLWCLDAQRIFTPNTEPCVTIAGKTYSLRRDLTRYFFLALRRSKKSAELVNSLEAVFTDNRASHLPAIAEYIQRCEHNSVFQDYLRWIRNFFG